jgi:circadian clock protein KaiC
MHLAILHKLVDEFKPDVFVFDPITTFITEGNQLEVKAMLTRLVDFLKTKQITGMFTSLTSPGANSLEQTEVGISSLMDTWLFLRDIELNGERNRGLYVLKSRGTAHSNQIREFVLSDHGVELIDVYLGARGVLTGTARLNEEAAERAEAAKQEQEVERKRRALELKRKSLEAKIAALRAEYEHERQEIEKSLDQDRRREQVLARQKKTLARLRRADVVSNGRRSP